MPKTQTFGTQGDPSISRVARCAGVLVSSMEGGGGHSAKENGFEIAMDAKAKRHSAPCSTDFCGKLGRTWPKIAHVRPNLALLRQSSAAPERPNSVSTGRNSGHMQPARIGRN